MTSCCWLVVMGSERFASPIMEIFCGGLNAYCMRIWPLFLRTSGSFGVLKALLLERNRQLSCNPKKKKKKKKKSYWGPCPSASLSTPQESFFFFFFFFFGRERYSLHKCNDSNLKSM